jgi:hypothetical protein
MTSPHDHFSADSPKKKRPKVDEVVSNEVDDELDSLEDAAVGQIIQGEDGEYYVLVNDDGTGTGRSLLPAYQVLLSQYCRLLVYLFIIVSS